MKTSLISNALLAFLLLSTPVLAQSPGFVWQVTFKPDVGVLIYPGGQLINSGAISVQPDEIFFLEFVSNDGFRFKSIKLDGQEQLVERPVDYFYNTYGPATRDSRIVVVSEALNPVGDFPLGSVNSPNTPRIGDISGAYTGGGNNVNPGVPNSNRPYQADVAMDESGKLDVMGSVDGVANKDGSPELDAGGAVKTRNAQGEAEYKGSLKGGSVDDVPASGSGSAILPLTLEMNSDNLPATDGVAKGSGTQDGQKSSATSTPVSVPLDPTEADQINTNWTFDLRITENFDSKGNANVFAQGILSLPDGTRTSFPAKKTRYSTKGYSVSFAQGIKVDGAGVPILDGKGNPLIDRKSKIKITGLTLAQNGAVWAPTDGTLNYKFLGQAGSGPLTGFLP